MPSHFFKKNYLAIKLTIRKDEILDFLRENKENIFIEFQVVKIGLFGSFARDEETDESDINLIVEFQPNSENLFEKKSKIRALMLMELRTEFNWICVSI